MLDRLHTEALRLIIQQVSPSIWQRKEHLQRLGLVCGRVRRASKPIADEIVHVNCSSAVDVVKRWPLATRKAVNVLLIGHEGAGDNSQDPSKLSERDLTRLMAALPTAKQVFLRHLEAEELPGLEAAVDAKHGTCELIRGASPYEECTALSIRESCVYFETSIDTSKFALRHLHIGSLQQEPENAPGSGLEQQLLTRKCLPHLETLRLSCHWLPRCSKAFLDQLSLIQIDLTADSLDWALGAMQAGLLETSTPLLVAYDESVIAQAPSPEISGLKYVRLESGYPHDVLNVIKALPDLEAVFFAGEFLRRDGRLGEIDRRGEEETREYFKSGCSVVIRPQAGDYDGVDPTFARYVRSGTFKG
ncbi:hypothetical protein JCM3774_002197 [Rhodotorula dairenensis]